MSLIHSFKIAGQPFSTAFINWLDSEIVATKDDSGTQLNITVNNVLFSNEAAVFCRDYIAGGITGSTPGIYEGPEFEMVIQDQNNSLTTFIACLDFNKDYVELNPTLIRTSLSRFQDKESVSEKSKVITMLLLLEEGIITQNDYVTIPYVVEKKFNGLEFIILSMTTFLLLKKLAETIKQLAHDIADVASLALGGVPISGQIASVAWAAAKIIINLAYDVLLAIYIADLIVDILEYTISPVRDWKGMKYNTMLSKGANRLGYTYSSSVDELENLYYLPSKDEPAPLSSQFQNLVTGLGVTGVIDDGIPNSSDIGHTLEELFSIHGDLFLSKMKIDDKNGVIHQEPLINDSFWNIPSGFILPNVLNETKIFNQKELKGRILIMFERDTRDDWTVDDSEGRMYEIVTHPKTISNPKCVKISGLEEYRPGVALASRKSELNAVEKALQNLSTVVDNTLSKFGASLNLSSKIKNRIGVLRVSQNTTGVPKMIYMVETANGLRIPSNHKDLFSSKALWKYHKENSFVETVNGVQNRGQKRMISDDPITIPIGFSDLINLIDSSIVSLQNGGTANITYLVAKPAKDKAKINGWTRETFTKNLKHTFYENDKP